MSTTFERPFSSADILKAAELLIAMFGGEDGVRRIQAGQIRREMTIVEKVGGKRRYYRVHETPIHKGHEVYVTVHVDKHRLNWRYETESPVYITEGN